MIRNNTKILRKEAEIRKEDNLRVRKGKEDEIMRKERKRRH